MYSPLAVQREGLWELNQCTVFHFNSPGKGTSSVVHEEKESYIQNLVLFVCLFVFKLSAFCWKKLWKAVLFLASSFNKIVPVSSVGLELVQTFFLTTLLLLFPLHLEVKMFPYLK